MKGGTSGGFIKLVRLYMAKDLFCRSGEVEIERNFETWVVCE
jgi:hypothetical protein